jgi:hypothetical protein
VHREHHTQDLELRIEHAPEQAERILKLAQTLEGVVLTLDGNEHAVGRGKAVDGQQAEGGGAVEQNEVVFLRHRPQGDLQASLACQLTGQLDLRAGEVDRGRHDRQVMDGRFHKCGGDRSAIAEAVVDSGGEQRPIDAEAAGGVALRIHVDEEDPAPQRRQTGPEVDRCSGLADTTLLVHYCDD